MIIKLNKICSRRSNCRDVCWSWVLDANWWIKWLTSLYIDTISAPGEAKSPAAFSLVFSRRITIDVIWTCRISGKIKSDVGPQTWISCIMKFEANSGGFYMLWLLRLHQFKTDLPQPLDRGYPLFFSYFLFLFYQNFSFQVGCKPLHVAEFWK